MPNGAETKPTADIWSDPNLMGILLGMVGQAAMGEHQQGWQAQLGRAATAMGQSRKAALAAEEMKGERQDWRDIIRSLISGGEGETQFQLPSDAFTSLGQPPAMEAPKTTEQLGVGQGIQPVKQRSLYDILR